VVFEEAHKGWPSLLADKRLGLVLDTVDQDWAATARQSWRDPFPVQVLQSPMGGCV